MLIVMKNEANNQDIERVCEVIQELGYEARPMPGAMRTAICVLGNQGGISPSHFIELPGVKEVIVVTKPYKLVSRETQHDDSIINVNGNLLGEGLTIIAGPCSVEHAESTLRIAGQLHEMGIKLFRAGAFKPRTNPYSFQGLGVEGLKILQQVKDRYQMTIVTEVMDSENLNVIAEVADILQVGTRNMHNFSLLKSLGKINKPVLLKRGMAATFDETMQAAEYIMAGGNHQVILCERGIRTFNEHCRNTLDVSIIPVLREASHLPVFADPSHAAGRTRLVAPLAKAAVAAGAQGLVIEVHDDAQHAYSDGQQALHPNDLKKLIPQLKLIYEVNR